jgi:hypothetical protein
VRQIQWEREGEGGRERGGKRGKEGERERKTDSLFKRTILKKNKDSLSWEENRKKDNETKRTLLYGKLNRELI